ncbi:uncharacterized protein EI90DRAFT_2501525 [Cantharellus anzutake]|uniref:uncharacterized protein n=1 Tax=Cantharellus anzutake TaxID=1750568 RepID=UPI00190514FC|nr:uncharacterized protein EI90DRAFT_2501525 [Cantharellus anzutake]KAF8321876.1 hypothetical protein EI90DRAFT_2501525 [Cantharellus anzutake]
MMIQFRLIPLQCNSRHNTIHLTMHQHVRVLTMASSDFNHPSHATFATQPHPTTSSNLNLWSYSFLNDVLDLDPPTISHYAYLHGLYSTSLTTHDMRLHLMHHILHAHCYGSLFDGCVEECNQLPPIDDHLQRLHDFLLSQSFAHPHQTLVGAALGVQCANESVSGDPHFLHGIIRRCQQIPAAFPDALTILRNLDRINHQDLVALC